MEVHFGDAAPASLHLLQGCKIKFDGPAPVSEYFKPTQTGEQHALPECEIYIQQ